MLPLFVKQFEETNKKKRNQVFEEEVQYLLSEHCGVEFDAIKQDNQSYTHYITHNTIYGILEYFPKSDKIHIHKLGSDGWKDKGLRWMIENFSI